MIYPILVTAALLCVWGTAAYMSVCGMVAVFGGHAVVIVSLAAGLELAKLMLIFHLHRSWSRLGSAARGFYILAILALVTLTAIEATGYLIESHTRDTAPITVDRTMLAGLTSETLALQRRIDTIDATLAHLPEGYVSRRLAEREAAGYARLQAELAAKLASLNAISVDIARAETQASPIVTIARLAGMDPARTLIAFVVLLVCIMEPISVGLAVAASSAWTGRNAVRPADLQKMMMDGSGTATGPAAIAVAGRAQEPSDAADGRPSAENADNETAGAAIVGDSEFARIVARHTLINVDIARITGRKQLETVDGWFEGRQQIPEKALRALRKWAAGRPVQSGRPAGPLRLLKTTR